MCASWLCKAWDHPCLWAQASVAEAAHAVLVVVILQSARADSEKLFLSLTYLWLNTYKEIWKDCSDRGIWRSKASLEPATVTIMCLSAERRSCSVAAAGFNVALKGEPRCDTGSLVFFILINHYENNNYSWSGLLSCSVFFSGDSFSGHNESRVEDRAID